MKSYTILLIAIAWLTTTSSSARQPNIIMIMADDLGYETIGVNGAEDYKTPVLDQLAKEGMLFKNCYANPICTPSRVKIMTGLSNIRNYVKFGQLDREQYTFAHELKKAGYATCIGGKWQLGKEKDSPQHFGFDESYLWQHTRSRTRAGSKHDSRFENPRLEVNGEEKNWDNGEFGPDVVTDYLCDFMERNKEKPFLVYFPMILTHCPFIPTPSSPDYDTTSKGSPTYKGDAKYFQGMVEHMDGLIGRLVKQLEDLNLRNDTILIFTGDNGTDRPVVTKWNGKEIAGAKGTLTDAGARVPLIISAPGIIKKAAVSEELVDHSDFFPTFRELAGTGGADKPALDGVSLLSTLKGEGSRNKPNLYIYYCPSGARDKGQIMARDAGFLMKRKATGKKIEFFKINGHYDLTALNSESLNDDERSSYKALKATIEEMDGNYQSHLKHLKK